MGQGLFWNLKQPNANWNLIKSWMEKKISKQHLGDCWGNLTVGCISIHIGDYRGLLLISLGMMLIFRVWRRMPLFSRDISWSIYEWNIVMFSTHFKRFTQIIRENVMLRWNPGWEYMGIHCTVLSLLYRFRFFQNTSKEEKSSGENLITKNMWCPVSRTSCFPGYLLSMCLVACPGLYLQI